MPPYKYRSPDLRQAFAPEGPPSLTGGRGREAPLVLIEEHLTEQFNETQYRQGVQQGKLVKNWYFPESWDGHSNEVSYVLKVQPFAKGGYEATVRALDLEKIGRAMEPQRRKGKREVPEECSVENQIKAAARAKKRMRHLVRNMMADHLVTFNKREGPATEGVLNGVKWRWSEEHWHAWNNGGRVAWEEEHGAFMTPEQWAECWDKFRRLMVRVIGEFPYVAILEKHRKGNYHLHVAWCGRVNVGLVRKMWLASLGGGKGCGNIDAKHIKVPSGGDRASRIARYITKYVTKHFENEPRYNKKRYWASRQTLEEARRYVLQADTLDGAVEQMRRMLGLDFTRFVRIDPVRGLRHDNMFPFPDGSGFWLSYVPELHDPGPPPF